MNLIIGLTGASGSILFKRSIEMLSLTEHTVYVIATDIGRQVFKYEVGIDLTTFLSDFNNVIIEDINNMFSTCASGSSNIDAMLIIPCSMGTCGKIANGTSDSLLIRSADVILKEKKVLVLNLRESPLNNIHINNMATLNQAGAILNFQVPSFYNLPKSIDQLIDDMVHRNLKYIGIKFPDELQWNVKK